MRKFYMNLVMEIVGFFVFNSAIAQVHLEIPIASATDDAEEAVSSGKVNTGSTDLEILDDEGLQIIGLRFQNVQIPQGATIDSAYIQFSTKASGTTTDQLTVIIYGEAVDNSTAITGSNKNLSSRVKTTESVIWNPSTDWGKNYDKTEKQRTSQIKTIINEIVNRSGWASGNSLTVLLTGTDQGAKRRNVFAWEDENKASVWLHVWYTPPVEGWYSKNDWSKAAYSLGSGNTGILQIEYDVTPQENKTDVVMAYSDSSTDVDKYSKLNMSVTLKETGFFAVLNGSVSGALVDLPYSAGKTYHVRVVTRLGEGKYDVWITPPGAAETQIADEYIFRTGAPAIDDLGKFILYSSKKDNDVLVKNHTVTPVSTPSEQQVHLEIPINKKEDDAEEATTDQWGPIGWISLTSSDLELIWDDCPQYVGTLFRNLEIPKGATIDSAYIQFVAKEGTSGAIDITIYGVDSANVIRITDQVMNISSRAATKAKVTWSPPPWLQDRDALRAQCTPNLKPIISEIIAKDGWKSGNNIMFVLTGKDQNNKNRNAYSFDSGKGTPVLHVWYTSSTTGSHKIQKLNPGFCIFPNPASAKLFIQNSSCDEFGYNIYNITGKLVKSGQNMAGPMAEVNVSDMKKGVYLIRLIAGEKTETHKIIIK